MKQQVAFLVPNKGLMVRDPMTKDPLLPDGELKPLIGPEGRYWRRRIRDGGIRIGSPPKPPAPVKKKKRMREV